MRRTFTGSPAVASRVRAAIRKQPGRLDNTKWFGIYSFSDRPVYGYASVGEIQETLARPIPVFSPDDPWPGLTACVGSWAAVLAAPPYSTVNFERQTISLTGGGTYPLRDYGSQELGLPDSDASHYLFLPQRSLEEIDAALSVIADRTPGRWGWEPLWSLTHARLGRPVADKPVI